MKTVEFATGLMGSVVGESAVDGSATGPEYSFHPLLYSEPELRFISVGASRALAASHPETNCWLVASGPLHAPGFRRLRCPDHQ